MWIYFSLHTILFLVSQLSHCLLFSTQLFYQRPKQKDRIIECKKSRGKARKEKQLSKEILFGKVIYGKGVKLERDQDMTAQNKPHWHQTYFELKIFEFPKHYLPKSRTSKVLNCHKSPVLKQIIEIAGLSDLPSSLKQVSRPWWRDVLQIPTGKECPFPREIRKSRPCSLPLPYTLCSIMVSHPSSNLE